MHGISNIDTTSMLGILELWIDKTWPSAHSLRFGLYDLNSEFDAIDTAGFFLNPAHGIGTDYAQSGERGPSLFPLTSLALRWQGSVSESMSYRIAILDAVPGNPENDNHGGIYWSSDEGLLLAAEADRQFSQSRLGLGAWFYTKETETLADPVQRDPSTRHNKGLYGFIDHAFAPVDWLPGQLNGFVRVGIADSQINQLSGYTGAGLVLSEFLAARPDDAVGLAVATGVTGADFKSLNRLEGVDTAAHETNFELSYRAPLGDVVSIQTNLQYVVNPGAERDSDDALVFGLRLELSLM
ncbi:MAG: carbohydrate porin [Pseudomonadota bacterium]|nr:carbohydrate porin [Pseudomonadota bacterium]